MALTNPLKGGEEAGDKGKTESTAMTVEDRI
jgi:hypothetical protein